MRTLVSTLVLLTCLTTLAQAEPITKTGIEGVVQLEESESAVKTRLGRPDASSPGMAAYKKLGLFLEFAEGKLWSITTVNPTYVTDKGVHVGSTFADVTKAYGPSRNTVAGNSPGGMIRIGAPKSMFGLSYDRTALMFIADAAKLSPSDISAKQLNPEAAVAMIKIQAGLPPAGK